MSFPCPSFRRSHALSSRPPARLRAPVLAACRRHHRPSRLVSRHDPVVTRVDPCRHPSRWATAASPSPPRMSRALRALGRSLARQGYPGQGNSSPAGPCTRPPIPTATNFADANQPFTAHGRTVGYPTNASSPAGQWLRENPHDVPLAQLALNFTRASGSRPPARRYPRHQSDARPLVRHRHQPLHPCRLAVTVTVACDPTTDALAVRLVSPLCRRRQTLGAGLAFPAQGHDSKVKNNPALDWSDPDGHTTAVVNQSDKALTLARTIDATRYQVGVNAAAPRPLSVPVLTPFKSVPPLATPSISRSASPGKTPGRTRTRRRPHHQHHRLGEIFELPGGAVDFTGSTDPRAPSSSGAWSSRSISPPSS